MDNQHKMIRGYRDLNEAEIALMNKIKEKFAEIQELLGEVNSVNEALVTVPENKELFQLAEPFRWSAIARTHAQEASMALTRAVAKPTFF
jgi:hypothetical protein